MGKATSSGIVERRDALKPGDDLFWFEFISNGATGVALSTAVLVDGLLIAACCDTSLIRFERADLPINRVTCESCGKVFRVREETHGSHMRFVVSQPEPEPLAMHVFDSARHLFSGRS